MKIEHFEIGVIGSGPGGLGAAFTAQAAGKSVVMVEEYLWGGTCPNYGCDPKKILLAAAEAKLQADALRLTGLHGEEKIVWPELMAHKMAFTEPITARKIAALDDAGVTHRYGHAEFINQHRVQVGADLILEADYWVIATGTRPVRLAVPGESLLLDNEDFLNLPEMPKKVTFIGGGFIAVEFASIAQAAGAQVHMVLHGDRILREFDADFAAEIVKQMEARGIIFHWNFETAEVTRDADDNTVITSTGGRQVTSALAFIAAGRQGNIDKLNLAAAGVKTNQNDIPVDNMLRTSVENIFAVGDVTNVAVPKITPTASREGKFAARVILGEATDGLTFPAVPEVVFGAPKLGQVGVKAVDAEVLGYTVNEIDMTAWMPYWRNQELVARMKVVLRPDGVIVGGTVLASHADELLNYLTVAINRHQTQADVKEEMYAYPSLGSDMSIFLAKK